ncbi:PHD and RING finger domain-containing protein 1 [Sesbania bispinosa]|nr:PHD and RING finger domain-containing protein 1 [Sesbania bispinosa]
MLIQSSLLSSVEDGLCYVSDDGKDVLCDRMPSGQTWQVCLKCNKYPLDWCRKAEPMEDGRRNVDDPYSSNCLSSFGRPSTASIMTENTAPNMVYRRKKLRKGSNAPIFKLGPTDVQTSVNFPSIISSSAHLSSTGDQSAGFQDKHEIEMVKNHTVPSMLFDGVAKDTTQKNLETEMDDSGECSSSSVIVMDATKEGLTEKDFCINILRSHGLLRGDSLADNAASLEDAFTTGNSYCSRQKILKEAIIRSPSIHSEMGKCRTASVKTELNPIMLMLKNTEPYTTGVRVGKGFQAEVLDWSGPKRRLLLS